MSVKVYGGDKIQTAYFVIIGIHGLVRQQTLNFTSSMTFQFEATENMLPSSSLIVYYIHQSGEVVFDQIELVFDDITLENQVS